MEDVIAELEYETLVFSRHQSELSGRARRAQGTLDHSAYTLLTLLSSDGPASIGELTAITGLDASTLNRQTAGIVRAGYAERISDPAGGLARKFRLTELGADMFEEERDGSRRALGTIVAEWEPSEREALVHLLRKLNLEIEGRRGTAWPRPASRTA